MSPQGGRRKVNPASCPLPSTACHNLRVLTYTYTQKIKRLVGRWWGAPLIPALGRQRQVDFCEFEANLVYRVSSRTGSKATQRNPISGRKKSNK